MKGRNNMKNKYMIVKTEVVTKTYTFNGVIDEDHNRDLCEYVIADSKRTRNRRRRKF